MFAFIVIPAPAFAAWADKNHPDEVARLGGNEGPTPETAPGWLKLAREWEQVRKKAAK